MSEDYLIRDYLWYREQYNVLDNVFNISETDNVELDRLSILLLKHLADLHQMKIAHTDIKPANIFYKDDTITTDIGTAIDLTCPMPDGTF